MSVAALRCSEMSVLPFRFVQMTGTECARVSIDNLFFVQDGNYLFMPPSWKIIKIHQTTTATARPILELRDSWSDLDQSPHLGFIQPDDNREKQEAILKFIRTAVIKIHSDEP